MAKREQSVKHEKQETSGIRRGLMPPAKHGTISREIIRKAVREVIARRLAS